MDRAALMRLVQQRGYRTSAFYKCRFDGPREYDDTDLRVKE